MPDERGRPYVYLAGPDVFYPDALLRGTRMKEALAARGMAGLFPLDDAIDPGGYGDIKQYALAIAASCEAQIHRADLGIFNIEPWRGPETDDGTAYELGFMTALGKPVVLHTNDMRPFTERIVADVYRGEVYRDGAVRRGTKDGMTIEEFGLADNLMLIAAAARSARLVMGERLDPAAIVHLSFDAAADFAVAIWQRREAHLAR
jgi:nucleoside 2-deoxyribosyltransferase